MLTLHSPRKFYEVLVNAMHSGRSSSWCLNVFSNKLRIWVFVMLKSLR